MNCPKCNIRISPNFCHDCGHPLHDVPVASSEGISNERVGGHKVGEDYTDVGNLDNVQGAAIGEGNTVANQSGTFEAQRLSGSEISVLWGVFRRSTFIASVIAVVIWGYWWETRRVNTIVTEVNATSEALVLEVTAIAGKLADVNATSEALALVATAMPTPLIMGRFTPTPRSDLIQIGTDTEEGYTYIIQDGDTIKGIAEEVYEDVEFYDQICLFNEIEIDNCSDVEVGTIIELPVLEELRSLNLYNTEIAPAPRERQNEASIEGGTEIPQKGRPLPGNP